MLFTIIATKFFGLLFHNLQHLRSIWKSFFLHHINFKAAASSLLYFMDSLLQQHLSISTAKEFFGCSSFHNLWNYRSMWQKRFFLSSSHQFQCCCCCCCFFVVCFGFNIVREFCHFHCKKSLVISAMTFNVEKHRQEVLFQIQFQSFFPFSSSSSSSSYVVHDQYWNVCGFALCLEILWWST
jgi:hypothetical protein